MAESDTRYPTLPGLFASGKQDRGIFLYAGALLVVCVGVSPIPGSLLSAGLPLLPEMPSIPSVELPDLPSIKIPDVVSFELPSMPSLKLPEAPSLPDLPSFQLPALPEIPSIEMPSVGLPSSVSSAISVVTDTASTAGGETKAAFISLWQKIAAWPLWSVFSLGSQPTGEQVEEKSDTVIDSEAEKVAAAAKIAAEEAEAAAAEEAARIAAEEAAKIAAAEEAAKLAEAEEAAKIAAAEEAAKLAAAEEAARIAAAEEEARVAAAEEAARIAAEEAAAQLAAEEAAKIAAEEAEAQRVAAEAAKIAAEAEAARIAAEEEARRISDEEQAAKDSEDAAANVNNAEEATGEASPEVVDPEEKAPVEPTLGDVENIDNQAATVIVESVAKAAKDIVVNIIEAAQDTEEEAKAETAEEVPAPEEKAGG